MNKRVLLCLLLLSAVFLTACESESHRETREQMEAARKVEADEQDRADTQSHQGAVNALALAKQHELDGVEQRRTGDVYTHSCRKAVAIDPALPVTVDTKGCTPDQLRLEQEAERRQMFEDATRKKD